MKKVIENSKLFPFPNLVCGEMDLQVEVSIPVRVLLQPAQLGHQAAHEPLHKHVARRTRSLGGFQAALLCLQKNRP